MKAELLFVGTELLMGQILNTNARYISRRLSELGVTCHRQTVVGDNMGRLRDIYREALLRCDILITTGGLGPTVDDITKRAAAEALGKPLPGADVQITRQRENFFCKRFWLYSLVLLRRSVLLSPRRLCAHV